MRVLVTGSSGFIGTHLVSELMKHGHEVVGADIREPEKYPAGLSFELCNILDGAGLRSVLDRQAPEAIVHLAAATGIDGRHVSEYATNVKGVENLVAAIRETPSVRRGVFTSSQLVCKVGYVPSHDVDYCPDTAYGKSKVLTEQIVRASDGGGIEWTLTRPITIWGPGMNAHYQRFFKLIMKRLYFHVGSRPLYKSYGYVGNVAHEYRTLLDAPMEQVHRETFYLADYEALSLRDWSDRFQAALGAKPILTLPEPVAQLAAKAGDVINALGLRSFPFNSFRLNNILTEYRFDLVKTQQVCGELPYTLDEGVSETVDWLRRESIVPI